MEMEVLASFVLAKGIGVGANFSDNIELWPSLVGPFYWTIS